MAKNYFTVKTLLDRAIEQAKADPRFVEAEKACPLENWGIRSSCQYDKLRSCAFDVIGYVGSPDFNDGNKSTNYVVPFVVDTH